MVYAWAIPFDPEEFLEELEDPVPEDLRTDLERLREEARAYAGRLERFTAVRIHRSLAHRGKRAAFVREALRAYIREGGLEASEVQT